MTDKVITINAPETAIEFFMTCYLGHYLTCETPDMHRDMYKLVESGDRRIVFACPRSGAKSTTFSLGYPLYCILEGVEWLPGLELLKILIVSDTASFAIDRLRLIKQELESNKYINDHFGDVRTSKWTEGHIICQVGNRRVEVMAKGAGSQIRGFRPHIVILDDLENDEAVRSDDQREKLRDWFNKALINTLEKESQLIMIGTMLHPLCLLKDVYDRPGYTTRLYKAILPDGTSFWPDKWPMSALMERKKEIGTIAFNSEFMNEPIISENPIFVKEWFREYATASLSSEFERGVYTVIACDPAISQKEGADYTAIVTVSATFDVPTRYYVRAKYCNRGHWPLNYTVDELRETYKGVGANALIVETVAFQQAVADEFRRKCEDEHWFPKLVEIKPDKDKERRAHKIAPLLERGQVYFDVSDIITKKLMDELIVFPTGDHDDLVDALVYALTELMKWSELRKVTTDEPCIVRPDGSGFSHSQVQGGWK